MLASVAAHDIWRVANQNETAKTARLYPMCARSLWKKAAHKWRHHWESVVAGVTASVALAASPSCPVPCVATAWMAASATMTPRPDKMTASGGQVGTQAEPAGRVCG